MLLIKIMSTNLKLKKISALAFSFCIIILGWIVFGFQGVSGTSKGYLFEISLVFVSVLFNVGTCSYKIPLSTSFALPQMSGKLCFHFH
jgi:hypothetical protein